MAPKSRTGRAAAETAYANLLKEHTTLVGDVGATFETLKAALAAVAAARSDYESARAAAIKAGAITNEQLDQLGYKKSPRLPVFKDETGATPAPAVSRSTPPAAEPSTPHTPEQDPQ